MKLLVATHETQGHRKNDFCWCRDGEILIFGSECSNEAVDGTCGCRRAMSGLDTLMGTTTMLVDDVEIDRDSLIQKIADHYKKDWNFDEETAGACAIDQADELINIGSAYEVGDVLERRGPKLQMRFSSAEASP